jgi:hypothetical protein
MVAAVIALALLGLGVAGFGFGSIAGMITVTSGLMSAFVRVGRQTAPGACFGKLFHPRHGDVVYSACHEFATVLRG